MKIINDKNLTDIYNFLNNKEEMIIIEKKLYYDDNNDNFVSDISNVKIYLIGVLNNIYYIFYSDAVRNKLINILKYKFPYLKFFLILYTNSLLKKLNNSLLYFVKNINVSNLTTSSEIFNYFNLLDEWMNKNKIIFINKDNSIIPFV